MDISYVNSLLPCLFGKEYIDVRAIMTGRPGYSSPSLLNHVSRKKVTDWILRGDRNIFDLGGFHSFVFKTVLQNTSGFENIIYRPNNNNFQNLSC